MRIFVTGAGGFIGRHLCAALEARRHAIAAAMQGADAVVHLANIAHARAAEAELRSVNVEGTLARAREAAAAGVRRFLYLSSSLAVDATPRCGGSTPPSEQARKGARGMGVVVLPPPLVYGPGVKANFLALMSAVARGIPLPLASIDNRRSLIYVDNLVDAILRCLELPRAAGMPLGVTDGAPVSIPQLCRE